MEKAMPTTLDKVVDALCLHLAPRRHLHQIPCPSAHCPSTCQSLGQERTRIDALAALCLTSKLINALTTPHLYRRPSCRKWPLLARTLVCRPDLARHVAYLSTRDWDLACDAVLDPAFPAEVSGFWEVRTTALYPETGSGGSRLESVETENFMVDILVALCPNIEELDAVLYYGDAFALSEPRSLARLRTVSVAYGDTRDGVCLGSLTPLAAAAPTLSRILGRQVGSSTELLEAFTNVTHVRLDWSTISLKSLRNILTACPGLESLAFLAAGTMVGYKQFTPLEAQAAIQELAPNLTSLHLDLGSAMSHDMLQGDAWVMRSLACLSRLETLALDTRCLVPHKNPHQNTMTKGPDGRYVPVDVGPIPELRSTALVDLLPPSIRELRIWRSAGPGVSKLGMALQGLASALPGRFSALARVVVSGAEGVGFDAVRSAFGETEVEFCSFDSSRDQSEH